MSAALLFAVVFIQGYPRPAAQPRQLAKSKQKSTNLLLSHEILRWEHIYSMTNRVNATKELPHQIHIKGLKNKFPALRPPPGPSLIRAPHPMCSITNY
jgi:hypothetical protein